MKILIKRDKLFFLIFLIIIIFSSCSPSQSNQESEPHNYIHEEVVSEASKESENEIDTAIDSQETSSPILETTRSFKNPEGSTMETRILPPQGYERIPSDPKEITTFLREFKLKEDGSKVLLYTGEEKSLQDGHVAIFDLDIGDRDLQQCADSIIRIYAEYYWSHGEYEKIAFHLTNGFLMEYTKWRDGNRLKVEGNNVRWVKTKNYDNSYECFRDYLNMVFAYAGTLSLSQECESIEIEELRPGDMFLQGGSPGHCVLIVDIAEDKHGNRCYLMAQGYMPAQDFHILKNPLHSEDPWYYASEITFPFHTPSWTFQEGSIVRWADFPLNKAENPTLPHNSRNAASIPAMSREAYSFSENKSSVTLLAVGDNLIHAEVIDSGRKENGNLNYDHLYANIKEEISEADIAIINQETILGGDDFEYTGYPAFNSPTEIGDAIVEAGFDVVLHATNHTLDKGLKGVLNTFEYWKQYPQITILGINESSEQREEIRIIEKNGIRIAMLNYTYGLNGYRIPKDMPYLVNLLDRKQMEADIKKAEELADFTIVFPHWGTEYVYEPTKEQKDLCQFFYKNGVDLVIGTHPHVLEPLEWIMDEEDKKMLVYYSLGNFMSYQKEAPRMLGGMAKVTISKDHSGTYISEAGITPIVTHYENGPSDYNYGIYKLMDYTPSLASKHGVSEIAKNGPMDYNASIALAKQILGDWFPRK